MFCFAFFAGALQPAPALAGHIGSTEASYAAVLRSINPKLPVERARAYARSVMADAWRTHLDPRFIMSIVTVESRWRSNALSRVGARGLGQLMPHTAATLGVNAWNPSDNLRGTSRYLSTLMNHFAGRKNGVALAIAGYNAGPRAVERFGGIPPYAETQNYVVRVLDVWKELKLRVGRAPAPEARAVRTPEERQWVTAVDAVLPLSTPVKAAGTLPASGTPADETER
jgi:soluble lytic murein transglycosylase-like protein